MNKTTKIRATAVIFLELHALHHPPEGRCFTADSDKTVVPVKLAKMG